MNSPTPSANQDRESKNRVILATLTAAFLLLTAAFFFNIWGHPASVTPIPLVDTNFLDIATIRQSYVDLVRTEADVSGFDCYACHEKNKPLPIQFDANHKIVLPKEHGEIKMAHGRHERNNNCYNCHNESNLELFQTRDGHDLKFAEAPNLCGSCHGPTFRDWEAGVHGRMNGFWNTSLGEARRNTCVNCHDPHAPKIPGRAPAPGPNLLHPEKNLASGKPSH